MMNENHNGEDANGNVISSTTTTDTTSNEAYYKFHPSERSSAFDELHQVVAAELKEVYAQDDISEHSNKDQELPKTPKRNVKRTKSAFKGVFKCGKKFKAQIQTHGVQHYLGLFETEEEAAKAYDSHARSILGVKAKTNFVYDPSEQPIPTSLPPPIADAAILHQIRNNGNSEDSNKLLAKRSYVGMKLRRKGAKVARTSTPENAPTNVGASVTPPPPPSEVVNPTSFVPPSFPSSPRQPLPHPGQENHSLLHLPLPLVQQSPLLFNNLPPGYAPVIHPMRFIPNLPFHHNVPLDRIPNPHELQIDWSKQAYTPLDISSSISSYRSNYTTSLVVPAQNGSSQKATLATDSSSSFERDWRDEIYYWNGKMKYSEQEGCLVWRGKWLGSFVGKPSYEEMQGSNNEFCYSSQVVDRRRIFPTSNSGMKPFSGYYQGYYLIGQEHDGQEKEQFADQSLYLEFQPMERDATGEHFEYDVYGIGYSEFGKFLLKGQFNARSEWLEVSRQYIAEHDPRYKMNLNEWKRFHNAS